MSVVRSFLPVTILFIAPLLLTVCNPGYYELAGDCVACDEGTYKPALGNEACTPCGYMETTATTASVNVSDCGELKRT